MGRRSADIHDGRPAGPTNLLRDAGVLPGAAAGARAGRAGPGAPGPGRRVPKAAARQRGAARRFDGP